MSKSVPLPEYRVMVVDDEPCIAKAVQRELTSSQGRHRYLVETFTDPRQALARAGEQTFAAVLSDYRMPELDGLSFLKALQEIQPDCARIVLSGQTDSLALVRMINETHIYRFIPKPWSSYFLRSSLAQAIELTQAGIENRRLAGLLRAKGGTLPIGTINPVDQILVVDDDVNDAHAVARCLTRRNLFEDVFREVHAEMLGAMPDIQPARISVQITDSPEHGLKMAEEVSFACVIADYRMPKMDGGQFLITFADKQPDCAFVMISGEVNLENLVIALDLAHIQAFIAKPWDDYELRTIIAQALMQRRLRLENRVLAQMCTAQGQDGAK